MRTWRKNSGVYCYSVEARSTASMHVICWRGLCSNHRGLTVLPRQHPSFPCSVLGFFLLLFKAWFAAAFESFISWQNKILCAHITTAQITTNQGWKLALFSRQVWTVSRQPRLFQSFPPSASPVKAVLFAFGHFFFFFYCIWFVFTNQTWQKAVFFFYSRSEGFKLPLVFADATQNWLLQTKQCALTSSRTKEETLQ